MKYTVYSSPSGTPSGAKVWISKDSSDGFTVEGYCWDKSSLLDHSGGDLELFLSVDKKDAELLATKIGVNSTIKLIEFIVDHFKQYEDSAFSQIREWLEKERIKYSTFSY